MDAKHLWKEFAMSDEGRELAAALQGVEDDQLDKLAELDHRISAGMALLGKRMDNKPLVAQKKCESETIYRSRYYSDHVELTVKLPTEMVLELGEMLSHYEDHNCVDAASGLDAFTKTILAVMIESLPPEVIIEHLEEEEDDPDHG